jgi:hypothetical protein
MPDDPTEPKDETRVPPWAFFDALDRMVAMITDLSKKLDA